jgi:hypothetical protein
MSNDLWASRADEIADHLSRILRLLPQLLQTCLQRPLFSYAHYGTCIIPGPARSQVLSGVLDK